MCDDLWSERDGCVHVGVWSYVSGCGQAHLCDWLGSRLQQRRCACLCLHLHVTAGLYGRVWGRQYGAGGRLWEGLHRNHGSAPHLILKEIREIHLITDELQHL